MGDSAPIRPLVVEGAVGDAHVGLALPTGTVAFLLTDIEGSTRLWEQDPDLMTAAVPRHYEVLDEVIARHGGVRPVEQGEGDSVVGAFARASDAVAAALDAQTALASETPALSVRMAVHAGEAQLRDGQNYIGHAVIRCARLRAGARGGQVLVSDAAAALVADRLPSSAGLVDRGVHRLRDLDRPERVWQLTHPDLDDDSGPLRSLDAFRHNLPTPPTPLVGRAAELIELRRLVLADRLVTITGSGGVGKTRLAQQVAADAVDRFDDGVCWVELAAVTEAARVAPSVAAALRAPEAAGVEPLDLLVGHLGATSLLLVIDNCEHVLDPVAEVVDRMLAGCPGVHVLTTSREPIGVVGETTWRAPSLALPPLRDGGDDVGGYDAVHLFVDRARQARPGFAVTPSSATQVAAICRRLDGIPLAIELAAARLRTLPLDRLATELDQRFRVLTGGARTTIARQRTIQASIEWSHDLLDEPERVVLRRLSAFVGGFTLDAAEVVAAGDPVGAEDVIDVLSHLVDKSLVQLEERTGRYRLLEAIRAFALDQAAATDDLASSRDRHLKWMTSLVADLDLDHAIPTISMAESLRPEYPNLLAALEWSLSTRPAVDLLGALNVVWSWRSLFSDAIEWTGRVLACVPAGSPEYGRAVAHAIGAFTAAGGPPFDEALLGSVVAAADGQGDRWVEGRLLVHAAAAHGTHLPDESQEELWDRAIAAARAVGDGAAELHAVTMRALFAALRSQPRRADALLGALADLELELDDYLHRYLIDWTRSVVAFQLGEFASGIAAATRAALDAPRAPRAGLLFMVCHTAIATGDLELLDRTMADVPAEAHLGLWLPWHRLLHAHRALLAGDHVGAAAAATEAVRIGSGGVPTPHLSAGAAHIAALAGHPTVAADILAEAAPPDPEDRMWLINATLAISLVGLAANDPLVEKNLVRGIEQMADDSQVGLLIQGFEALACVGDLERTVRLVATATAARDRFGYRFPIPTMVEERTAVRLAEARESLGDEAVDALWAEGSALDLDAAADALRRPAVGRPAFGWDSLTPAELVVVDLVAEGLTNPQIAERLVVSTHTVKTHLQHVFTKLDVHTRSELAAAAVARRNGA